MALTLYPAIDIQDGRTVGPGRGRIDRGRGPGTDPVEAAREFVDAGSEWLHVVDLDAAFTGEARNRHLITEIVSATGVRVQASGGVRSVADVESSLRYGAERVVIGTAALQEPDLVREILDRVGPRIAVGLDAVGHTLQARGGSEQSGDLFLAVETLTELGVPRLVYTDAAKDGTLGGPNLDMLCRVADATTASVTASGGVATLDDLRMLAGCHHRVDAAIVGTALHTGAFSIEEALAAAGA